MKRNGIMRQALRSAGRQSVPPVSAARVTVILLVVVLVIASAAFAQTSGGYLSGGELGAGVSTPGGSGSAGAGAGAGAGSSSGGGGGAVPECTAQGVTGPISYRVLSDSEVAPLAAGPRPDELNPGHSILAGRPDVAPTVNNPTPAPSPGTWYAKMCGGAQAGYVWVPQGAGLPAPPPPPPTPAEMWDRVPLPAPAFGISPTGDGLTGLDSWLWDGTAPTTRTVTVTIRGYTSTATANPVRWEWNMRDSGPAGANPPGTVSASSPGSADHPAVTYRYETKGDYTVSLSVVWSGSFTYSGNGVVAVTRPLGTSSRTTSRGYTVDEVRPVLVAER